MTHEDFSRKLPSRTIGDRTFGLVVTGILTVAGLLPLLRSHPPRRWALIAAAVFLIMTFATPKLLSVVKRYWIRFGHLMNTVVSHVVSALLLLLVFAPVRLFFLMSGRDLLGLRFDSRMDTYWIRRDPPGPTPESMTHQF